ncbi:MAG: DUF6799 domain-containing protein [Ferruginibacter sp.]
MKKLLMITMIFVAGNTMHAQTTKTSTQQKDTIPVQKNVATEDYVSMQGGQMIHVQKNKAQRLKKNMKMKNGTIIDTNGSVRTSDGKTFQLHEGDRVYMNGKIEGPEKTPI